MAKGKNLGEISVDLRVGQQAFPVEIRVNRFSVVRMPSVLIVGVSLAAAEMGFGPVNQFAFSISKVDLHRNADRLTNYAAQVGMVPNGGKQLSAGLNVPADGFIREVNFVQASRSGSDAELCLFSYPLLSALNASGKPGTKKEVIDSLTPIARLTSSLEMHIELIMALFSDVGEEA